MSKLLIVVDFQNDFVDGALGFDDAIKVAKPIYEKIEAYHQKGYDVIFTRDTHDENYLNTQEGRNLPVVHCIKDTDGWQIYGEANEFAKKHALKIFDKPAFGSLELGNYIQGRVYEEVEIAGLVSNICVVSTSVIVKAALPEALVIVDAKATDSYDEKLHEASLDVMEGFQVKVIR